MIRSAWMLGPNGCRAFSRSSQVLSTQKPPPWALEKLVNEGHSPDEIKKHGWQKLIRQQHGIRPDILIAGHRLIDFDRMSWKRFQESKRARDMRKLMNEQKFNKMRQDTLGAELSAATFVVHRGAAVRLHGRERWIIRDPETEQYDLPKTRVKGISVEAIDMRNFHILCCGFENLAGLGNLRSLALRNQPYVDDWVLDTVSGLFHSTLEHIDISGCPKVTERGITILHRCLKLQTIRMNGMPNVKNAELVALELEGALPDVVIEGVNYWHEANS